MDTLIALIILGAITIVSAWIKKKQQEAGQHQGEEDWPGRPRSPGAPTAPPPPRRRIDWEQEMRRLLEGVEPERPPLPAPPPIPRPARAEAPAPPRPQPAPSMVVAAEERAAELRAEAARKLRAAEAALRERDVRRLRAHPVGQQAAHLLRDRRSLRAVMLASVILGPPTGMQPPASW